MSSTNNNLQTQTSNALHNAIMEAGGKDRPSMLAPAIERLKQGESINVQDLETNLYWEFNKFTSRNDESLESYYSKFYKMMNELVRNKCDVTNHQVNVQFLLQLEPEEQADWRDDTDDEPDDQELEAHYMYMEKIQEVTPDAADNSGPIFDVGPLQKIQNDDGDTNITTNSLDMSNNGGKDDQDDDDLAREQHVKPDHDEAHLNEETTLILLCQPIDQNIDSSDLDQIQSPQYPVNHHLSQEDVEEVLHDKEFFLQDTQTFLEKFNRFSFGFTPRVLTIAWERIDKIKYVLTEPEEIPELMYKLREDEDEEYTIQYREYLEKSPDAVTTILPNKEPEYSLSMGYKHLNTTLKTESDEIIKSGVEELALILSENEVTSEDKRKCDMLVCENSPVCDNHSKILSDSNDDDILSDDDAFEDIEYVEASLPDPEIVSLEEENDVQQEEEEVNLKDIFQIQDVILREKLLSINRLIANIESLNDNPTPDRVLNSFASFPIFEESDNSLSDNSSPEFETFSDHTKETRSGNTTTHANNSLPEYDSFCFEIEPDQERLTSVFKNDISDDSSNDLLLEEVDLFIASDNSIPSGIENFDYDSEGDIRFLEGLLIDDSIPFPNNKSFDSENDPLFPRPPPEPPDVEFDFKPDSKEVILVVMNTIDVLNKDDPRGEFDISTNDEDDDCFSFMFVIRIFLPYLIFLEVFLLLLSAESEDTIFDPVISI
uniref:Uncharacterized protein n=1 Tax=Tanacetum cinerariifolium TaxID=118510 RepID=A0A6L2P649_TANCI|nr:hypothetical protein [Tanacetum cinerariifolium]